MLATGPNYTEVVRLMLSHKADAYEANQVSMRDREKGREKRERERRASIFNIILGT